MKIAQVSCFFMIVVACSASQASEYFKRYNVDQPRISKQPTQRAIEYERAYNKDTKERATGFYNRLKAALGFKPSVQPRPRVKDTRSSVDVEESAKPVQDLEIVKVKNDRFGFEKFSARNAGQEIGEITYLPSRCWIGDLNVTEKFQKKGIGSKLFKSAVNQMNDCESIRWWASPNSVNFYQKQGARIDHHSQNSNHCLEMLLDKTNYASRIKR